ncbi:MAG: hypothetical protein ACAI35_04745, partial [Candidatus Methylacidiphilales bacterium]
EGGVFRKSALPRMRGVSVIRSGAFEDVATTRTCVRNMVSWSLGGSIYPLHALVGDFFTTKARRHQVSDGISNLCAFHCRRTASEPPADFN